MANESQEDRAYYDKRIRESRILSQLYADRQTQHDRAKLLLREVEKYQTRVLVCAHLHHRLCPAEKTETQSASRNSQPPDTLMLFEDELTDTASTSSKFSVCCKSQSLHCE
jgi:hypothetical protein